MRIFNSAVKIISLGVGMAIGLVILAQVCFQLSYDRHIPDVDRIFMIRSEFNQQGTVSEFHNISGAVAPGFKSDLPEVVEATRFSGRFDSDKYFDEDKNILMAEHRLLLADDSFFKIFPREFIAGNPEEALSSWSGAIAVSRSFADKLGGAAEAIGKTVVNEERPDLPLHIVGVYEDFPENSTINVDILGCIEAFGQWSIENWIGNDRYQGFVKLAPGVDYTTLAPSIRKMQEVHQPLVEFEQTGISLKYYLKPMKNYHISDPDVRNQVVVLSVIAFLLILISLLNYILIAVTEVIKRSREVGVRKCYGAGRKEIYLLLFKESTLNIVLSLAVSAAVILSLKNFIESLTRAQITDMIIPETVWTVAVTVLLILLISALVPARLFERIPISSAFRGYRETRRKWKKSLLTFQFCINVFLLIMVLVGSLQYRLIMKEDVGYDTENLISLRLGGTPKSSVNPILDRLKTLPFVDGAAVTYDVPLSGASGNNVYFLEDTKQLFNIADEYEASEGYHAMMGFRLIDGDYPKTVDEVLVSQSFLVKMAQFADWSDGAVGKSVCISEHSEINETDIKGFTICGVVEDVRIGNAVNNDTRPAVWFLGDIETDYMRILAVRLNELNQKNIQAVEDVVRELGDEADVSAVLYTDVLRDMYVFQKNMKNTFLVGAIASLLIALFGLVGFLGDETNRRGTEIAIRKVNGALSAEVVKMFVSDILKLALIAIIIGDIAGWYIASRWLEMFPDRVSLQPWYFLAADLVFIAVIASIVTVCSLRVSHSNPADALKKD